MNRTRALEYIGRRRRYIERRIAEADPTDRRTPYFRAELAAIDTLVSGLPAQRLDIAELLAITNATTPGEWFVVGPPWSDGTHVMAGNPDPHAGTFVTDCQAITEDENDDLVTYEKTNAAFIARAKTAVPELCDRVTFLEDVIRQIGEAIGDHGKDCDCDSESDPDPDDPDCLPHRISDLVYLAQYGRKPR